ncbi:putative bifunctional diguanylate cyclase/phosphodiesterase [Granulosicoccus antarcticus]|uniref:Cyclic di-GMP phosphodiesterase Gmr n=1 Tax=Granulosicoccus antarcticus IMCC3135 TaxID=1192854 RepID=A0A2Z2NZ39_9GAMM|nr:EAL domain-containing protein [Granulosicoccus antarcticus]ASJ75695.1 Cyclic di-GMP phosphodiesterase Gmr [Granulosicoccus antarcticus IMCC3135]
MTEQLSIESAEQLREALLALRHEHDALLERNSQGQQLLDALDSLLDLDVADDPFIRVFASLRKIFTFSEAMMLAEPTGVAADAGNPLECIVAEPASLVSSTWSVGPLFRKVLAGRVVATFSNVGVVEWSGIGPSVLSVEQSALYVPVGVRGRRGILVLLRALGEEGYNRNHIELARRFSLLASHALATRFASETAAEGHRLRELTEQLKQSEQLAKRNASLLQEMVNVLPVGVAVQDELGRLLIANDAVSSIYGLSADEIIGTVPIAMGSNDPQFVSAQHRRYSDQLRSGKQKTREKTVNLAGIEHTLLVTEKPVSINNESLLLTASLDITDRKHFEEELSHRAFHDELTGLPNRELMHQLVDVALRTHEGSGQFALAFIDLDNFKQVNDYYSHAIGDGLLKAMSHRVSQSIRNGDTLARISGDEFLILIDPLEDSETLSLVINRVLDALKEPFCIEGHEVMTSASVGASIYPLHGDSYESLRRCADSAMYRAKSSRKGSVSYFDESMRETLTARMDLEQRLRVAIREKRFVVAFQPKVDITNGTVDAFEALIRWVEEDGTIRMPGDFIELASELGLLDDITRFALQDVVCNIPILSTLYGNHITVSINVAAPQAGDVTFMRSFIKELAATGFAERIVLELTEDALVATQRFQHQVLPELRSLGVRVSIDDFGTGYSSLSTLADITADEVKVDRAFITAIHDRPRSQGILRAIESLCTALDIEMVAEGVETIEELEYLRDQTRIRLVQGYYFSKPVFIEELQKNPTIANMQASLNAPLRLRA